MSFGLEFDYFAEELEENVICSVDFTFTIPYANADSDWDASQHVQIEGITFWRNGCEYGGVIAISHELIYSEISAFIREAEITRAFDEDAYHAD